MTTRSHDARQVPFPASRSKIRFFGRREAESLEFTPASSLGHVRGRGKGSTRTVVPCFSFPKDLQCYGKTSLLPMAGDSSRLHEMHTHS